MSSYVQDVKVKYGDFTFPVPTPFVSKSFSNQFVGGNLWLTKVSVSLTGKIALLPKDDDTSGNNYLELSKKRNKIAEEFAGALGKNFLNFSVKGGGADFDLKNCIVESVSFDNENYVGVVGYNITLSGYRSDKDFYTANYGIQDPVDSWAYTEQNGVGSMTHTISARGLNTSQDDIESDPSHLNSFSKAKAFVDSRKGLSNKVNSILIRNVHPDSSFILTSSTEEINRLGGSYSVTEVYTFATNDSSLSTEEEASLPSIQTGNILTTYSISFEDSHGSDFVGVSISGSIVGSNNRSVTWDQIKSDFRNIDFYQLANKAYRRYIVGVGGTRAGAGDNTTLHKTPTVFTITPNEDANQIGFNISYDNNTIVEKCKIKNNDSYFDYNISFNHNNINDIITVSCNGTIITRGSLDKKNREGKILLDLMLANNNKIVRDEMQRIYNLMFPNRTQYKLSPNPDSITASLNEFEGTISFAMNLSDQDFPENSNLKGLSYTISLTPPLQRYTAVPSALQNGHSLIYDINLKSARESVTVSSQASVKDRTENTFSAGKDEIESISTLVSDSFLDGTVIRLQSESKIENKDFSNITYNRAFTQEKAIEDLRLDRLDN